MQALDFIKKTHREYIGKINNNCFDKDNHNYKYYYNLYYNPFCEINDYQFNSDNNLVIIKLGNDRWGYIIKNLNSSQNEIKTCIINDDNNINRYCNYNNKNKNVIYVPQTDKNITYIAFCVNDYVNKFKKIIFKYSLSNVNKILIDGLQEIIITKKIPKLLKLFCLNFKILKIKCLQPNLKELVFQFNHNYYYKINIISILNYINHILNLLPQLKEIQIIIKYNNDSNLNKKLEYEKKFFIVKKLKINKHFNYYFDDKFIKQNYIKHNFIKK